METPWRRKSFTRRPAGARSNIEVQRNHACLSSESACVYFKRPLGISGCLEAPCMIWRWPTRIRGREQEHGSSNVSVRCSSAWPFRCFLPLVASPTRALLSANATTAALKEGRRFRKQSALPLTQLLVIWQLRPANEAVSILPLSSFSLCWLPGLSRSPRATAQNIILHMQVRVESSKAKK